ncbi:MAG: GntR family transcriptional regulator [Alphaproteobacteria bacterium]|nr:GntR family transcriptional regulator [Alphaproteobacteria bacterium]
MSKDETDQAEARGPARRPGEGTADSIAAALQLRIREGELGPGDPLRERTLAAEFGVSRGPVREALRSLAARGLVTIEPNRGARVQQLSAADVGDYLDIATSLMRLAVQKAATRRRPEDAAGLSAAIDALAAAAGTDARSFATAEARCLRQILTVARCPRLVALMEEYVFHGPGAIYSAFGVATPGRRRTAMGNWRKLVEMILEGQEEAAGRLMERMHKAGIDSARHLIGIRAPR